MRRFIKEVIIHKKYSDKFRVNYTITKLNGMILRIKLSAIVNINLITLMFIFGFSSLRGVSQSLTRINLEEIPQRKVRRYIVSRKIDQMHDFSSIHASWNKNSNKSDFDVNEKIFYLKYKLSNVWECYWHTNLFQTWNGQSVRLGLLISKYFNSVIYTNNSSFPEIDTGQVYFLNLKVMQGLFNVPMAFEIININDKQHIVEISYIDNNKSKGKQTIQFFDNGDGRTRIVHSSYFKSDSWLREDFFYPYFHKKFIKEFHRNMMQIIKNKDLNVPINN